MSAQNGQKLPVLVNIPMAVDSKLVCNILIASGIECVCLDYDGLENQMSTGVGALLLASESLTEKMRTTLSRLASSEPDWSELPILIIHSKDFSVPLSKKDIDTIGLNRLYFIEKPLQRSSFLTLMRAALQSRKRQYEVRDLLEQLRAANKKLEELSQLKNEFVSMASHELRSPITTLVGFSQILLNQGDELELEEKTRYLEIIESESRRLGSLVNELLDISKIESGKIHLDFREADIVELAKAVVAAKTVKYSDIQFGLKIPDSPIILKIDEDRIREVFYNLLDNATRFSNPGDTIEIIITEQAEVAQICVRDYGRGIHPDEVDKIFNKFYRGKIQVSSHKSSGLGLAISKAIIEAHGGEIWVESELDKGSTFCFKLRKFL